MFEDLKARRLGRSAKESARLWVTLAAAAACGTFIFGSKACSSSETVEIRPSVNAGAEDVTRPLDRKPLEYLRTAPAAPGAFDQKALDHLMREIASESVRSEPDDRLPLAAVAALDPAQAVGRLVETSGTVRGLDAEVYQSPGAPNVDQLWGFALEGDDGTRVLVVKGGNTSSADGGRPAEATRAGGTPDLVAEGTRIKVRGYYLQRRTGSVGGVKDVEKPTAVLVGRAFRLSFPDLPKIASLKDAAWSAVKDRSRSETLNLGDQAIYEVLVWARDRGAKALADDLASGRLPSKFWGSSTFQDWGRQIGDDRDQTRPDPRTMTLESRGQVFETTGVLIAQDHEDWEHVPRNLYGVDERWKYWFVSDFYANVTFLVDSPFPLAEFPGVRPPQSPRYQRVKLYGVFTKVYSYAPSKAHLRPDKEPVVTVPYFVLLHLEPDENTYRQAPLWENPFFWTGISLALFLATFLFVMTRMERKEEASIHAHRVRLRKPIGRLPVRGAPPEGAPPPTDPPRPDAP